MEYRIVIPYTPTIGCAKTGERNCPRYSEDVITPTDLPRNEGSAMLITHNRMEGMSSPIPAPEKRAKNIVSGND